jgi:Ca-activated chloride channel family protein
MRYREAMGSAFDVVAFLAYAATLGLLIGLLLGVLALLLAAPAHAAGQASGSLLLHRPPGEEASAAPLISTETVFRTDGPIQRVRIVQAFRNPLAERQEGLYVLRLPEEATLERIAVRVRERSAEDESADDDAEEGLPEAVPGDALISGTESAGVVTRAIAGIEPGETVLIELEYQQVVRYDRSKSGLRILTRAPLAISGAARRRRLARDRYRSVPLGVEGAWLAGTREAGPPWLWLLPVVGLYVLVAFFS